MWPSISVQAGVGEAGTGVTVGVDEVVGVAEGGGRGVAVVVEVAVRVGLAVGGTGVDEGTGTDVTVGIASPTAQPASPIRQNSAASRMALRILATPYLV